MISDSNSITTYSIENFIKYRTSDSNIYYSDLSIFEESIDGKSVLLSYNILNDYTPEILDHAKSVVLSQEEFKKYQYKPKLLAYDIYGSCEYYYIILFVNSMASVKEFNKKNIKLIPPSDLSYILSDIYSSERDVLNNNHKILDK